MQPIEVVGRAKARLRRAHHSKYSARCYKDGGHACALPTLRQPANFRFDFQTAKDNSVVERSSRVPDAVQRSSRCTAEPGPMATRSAQWAPDQQRTTPRSAARCAASGERIPRPCPNYKRDFAISRRDAPGICIYLSPLGGRGECRVPAAPAASCAIVVIERTRVATSTPESPGIPARNGFNSLYRALPGDRAVLPPSPAD
jgi:hypothetical protein